MVNKRRRTDERKRSRLGRPQYVPDSRTYVTSGGISVHRKVAAVPAADVPGRVSELLAALDSRRGAFFESAYEFPQRYARWTMGFVDPPLSITIRHFQAVVRPVTARGRQLVRILHASLSRYEGLKCGDVGAGENDGFVVSIEHPEGLTRFAEEDRSRRPSAFTLVRAVRDAFGSVEDPQLGLYGAFGYDLTFQFEECKFARERDSSQRDVVLYLPDRIFVCDQRTESAWEIRYDFETVDFPLSVIEDCEDLEAKPYMPKENAQPSRDHSPGEFARSVLKAKQEFKVGNLFECVLSQCFSEPCVSQPSEVFARLKIRNPSPYMFVCNLGNSEWLVGASPEMFVRVERTEDDSLRVETCPISGTIPRGVDALEDAKHIAKILADPKEESELTMCTDVDRNDKSRICEPGSVQVLGRRQIEKYSKLIHTVDHVEGILRQGYDALDAFSTHLWAVTVTGAPKPWAMQFVENNEKSNRCWYAGAVGLVGFDGTLNTGMTLRTIRLHHGVATIRAGATLLFDSDPASEEAETELKASAFRDAVVSSSENLAVSDDDDDDDDDESAPRASESRKNVLLVDHQDSFVHTLANYLRQTVSKNSIVRTVRFDRLADSDFENVSLCVLSPGPGKPSDFNVSKTIDKCLKFRVPIFGVCLGLQSLVEHFGGKLGVLPYPMHGKPSIIKIDPNSIIFKDISESEFVVARYHSLYATRLPDCLIPTASTVDDEIVMAIEHETLPIAAVQFHPESILTAKADGISMLRAALTHLPAMRKF